MNLTLRQRNILQILIDEPSEVTLAHIAQKIKVSIRTVHRELVSLSRNLERDYGIRLQARPGLGLKLAGDAEGITGAGMTYRNRCQAIQARKNDSECCVSCFWNRMRR